MAEVKQIRLEKWTSTRDGSGDFKETVEKYNIYAEVSDEGGDRSSLNGITALTNFKQFRINYRPDWNVTAVWKVIYWGKEYAVHSIKPESERRFKLIIIGEAK